MQRRRAGPKVDWKVSIPAELAMNIELLFCDPGRNKPDYGARSALVTHLLEQFWEDRQRQKRQIRETTAP